jgi:hypothetical protein
MKIRKSFHLTVLAIWVRRYEARCTSLAAAGENLGHATSRVRTAPHGAHGAPCMTACFAALLFACIGIPNANADTLGRLFFTPEQRQQLDYAYARNAAANGNTATILTVNGIVQKHGGARTVWVNGVAQSADNSGERNPTAQTVAVPGKSRPVKLKVGDKIMLDQSAPARQDSPTD